MKKVLLVLILFASYFCNAQHYQCLQSGVKPFYTNGNGYLRGMRIDSVRASGSDTIYYPYHTPRGNYADSSLDSTGGSWLGKKVGLLSRSFMPLLVFSTNTLAPDKQRWKHGRNTTTLGMDV